MAAWQSSWRRAAARARDCPRKRAGEPGLSSVHEAVFPHEVVEQVVVLIVLIDLHGDVLRVIADLQFCKWDISLSLARDLESDLLDSALNADNIYWHRVDTQNVLAVVARIDQHLDRGVHQRVVIQPLLFLE